MLQRIHRTRQRPADPALVGAFTALGRGGPGMCGVVASVGGHASRSSRGADQGDGDLERRLLEIGFVEGARVEILHQGAVGGDPIAVRLDDMRVALRRREADAVMVQVSEVGRRARVRAA